MLNVPASQISIGLDRSGSMNQIRDDVVGGFNAFLAEQRELPEEARLSLFQFDDQYETVHEGLALADVPDMTHDCFQPRGSTALLDAIGRGIADTQRAIGTESTNPRVLFVIITDGQENASREFDHPTIMNLIRKLESEQNWRFVYIGADQDAIATAAAYGIRADSSLSWNATAQGSAQMMKQFSSSTARYRSSQRPKDDEFFEDDDPRKDKP